ncbi:hypothetical protein [Pseudoxanthomonas sacheonensis]|uniref:Uncharacterized protein n=1 Tax=Pseudoxanthomonas sacheonensis TaxID=443615 RepID=A0ABU1RU18_9GAMM|nr:hypothetical protein [Pseudoxanthomonas sacheonensis]MDR6842268.1 hypothetical protein [Pseudoxanthomonas sacheonensis]
MRAQIEIVTRAVIPAKAGGASLTAEWLVIQLDLGFSLRPEKEAKSKWIPAFAGMTTEGVSA